MFERFALLRQKTTVADTPTIKWCADKHCIFRFIYCAIFFTKMKCIAFATKGYHFIKLCPVKCLSDFALVFLFAKVALFCTTPPAPNALHAFATALRAVRRFENRRCGLPGEKESETRASNITQATKHITNHAIKTHTLTTKQITNQKSKCKQPIHSKYN